MVFQEYFFIVKAVFEIVKEEGVVYVKITLTLFLHPLISLRRLSSKKRSLTGSGILRVHYIEAARGTSSHASVLRSRAHKIICCVPLRIKT